MISHCDICDKIFDTDVEVGAIKDGVTYCETCAVDAGLVDYEDGDMTAEEQIISLLNGDTSAEEKLSDLPDSTLAILKKYEQKYRSQLARVGGDVKLTDDGWLRVDAEDPEKAVNQLAQLPDDNGYVPQIVNKLPNGSVDVGLAQSKTIALAKESFQQRYVGAKVSYEEVFMGGTSSTDKLDDVVRLSKKIGLKTMSDLQIFYTNEREGSETILQTLNRYYDELGEEYDEVAATVADESVPATEVDEADEDAIAEVIGRAVDDFEAMHRAEGITVAVDQNGQAGTYSTQFTLYDKDENAMGSTDDIPDSQLLSQPDHYSFIIAALNGVLHQAMPVEQGVLSVQAKEFLEDPENQIYAEKIGAFEREFHVVNGDELKNTTELVDDFILANAEFFDLREEGHEQECYDDTYYLDWTANDFDHKVTDIKYYIEDDGRLGIEVEVEHHGEVTGQTASRDSGNYYEPPVWDEKDFELFAASGIKIIIPDNVEDYDEYDFIEDEDFDVEVE
ncbi:MAG: hypothetical protein NC218_02425 [Acetobacter sp.]|nr:hypothetical protein [Acetobacter sp.]